MLEQLAKHFESKLKTFDAYDSTDLMHYFSLRYKGRQLERRYVLEQPFPDVVVMMQHKIAERMLKDTFSTLNFNYG